MKNNFNCSEGLNELTNRELKSELTNREKGTVYQNVFQRAVYFSFWKS